MSVYEIRVQEHLDQRWLTWFDGLTISYESEDITVLRGPLVEDTRGGPIVGIPGGNGQ